MTKHFIFSFAGNLILQTQLPHHYDVLATCGDVESNPGPSVLLSDELLQSLSSGNHSAIQPVERLKNKHVIQLFQLKEKHKCTWDTAVTWLKLLIKDFPGPSDVNTTWTRNIGDSWKSLKAARRRLQSDKNKSDKGKEQFDAWEEATYQLPSVRGPRVPKVTPPGISKFELECLTATSMKLEEEKKEAMKEVNNLALQVEALKQRQSPHSQANQDRREQRKNTQIKNLPTGEKTQLAELDKLNTKVDKIKKTKRKFSSEFNGSLAKISRIEEDTNFEKDAYILGIEDDIVSAEPKIDDLKEELLQCKEVNAILMDAALMWRTKLAEEQNQELLLLVNGSFTNNLRKCVYELLGCHVMEPEDLLMALQAVQVNLRVEIRPSRLPDMALGPSRRWELHLSTKVYKLVSF